MKLTDAQIDDLDGRLSVAAGHQNAANVHLVALVSEMLATGAWDHSGMRSPEQFLVWKLGLSPERAGVIVRVARKLPEFPTVRGCFEAGEFSMEQVAELVKAPAWADEQIIDIGRVSTVPKLRRAMRKNMFDHGPHQPDDPHAPPAQDRLSFGVGRDGRWRLRGEFDIADGKRIEAAICERTDALFTAGDETVSHPEAFLDCIQRSLDAVDSPSRRESHRVWFHLDVTFGAMTTTDGWRIPMALQEHLLCDGQIAPVWERDGTPFSVGRTQRIVPDRTRRIIEHRDHGCRAPGCSSEHGIEIHHIWHWLDGGPTDTWNLLSLCRRHHRLHHQGRLGITGNADQSDGVIFTDQHGRPIEPVGRARPPTRPIPPLPQPYQPPLNARFDWAWIGGWTHPDELHRRRNQWRERAPDAA